VPGMDPKDAVRVQELLQDRLSSRARDDYRLDGTGGTRRRGTSTR